MNIVSYEATDDVPEGKRHLAQYSGVNKHLIFSFYGQTAEEARAKAQAFWEKEVMPKAKTKAQAASEAADPTSQDEPDDLFGDLL